MLYYLGNRGASVAQSVEQLIRNQQVAGENRKIFAGFLFYLFGFSGVEIA